MILVNLQCVFRISPIYLALTIFMQYGMGKIVEYNYRKYGANVDVCDAISWPRRVNKSSTWCALRCAKTSLCCAFRYMSKDQTCSICQCMKVSTLSFADEGTFFMINSIAYNVNPISLGKPVKCNALLKPGNMVYLSITSEPEISFNVTFQRPSQGGTEIPLYFAPYASASESYIYLNHWIRGKWGPGMKNAQPFPFSPGKRTGIYILLKPDSYLIYINSNFYKRYGEPQPPGGGGGGGGGPSGGPGHDITEVIVNGNILIHELSC